MAYYAFAEAIVAAEPIIVYGEQHPAVRRPPVINDIAGGIAPVTRQFHPSQPRLGPDLTPTRPAAGTPGACTTSATANKSPSTLQTVLNHPAQRIDVGEQPADVSATHSDVTDFEQAVAVRPKVPRRGTPPIYSMAADVPPHLTSFNPTDDRTL